MDAKLIRSLRALLRVIRNRGEEINDKVIVGNADAGLEIIKNIAAKDRRSKQPPVDKKASKNEDL